MYKAMVVDDHPFIRASVKMLLEQQQFTVIAEAGNGADAVQLARDLDVLVTTLGEIPQGRVIPMGRLREPLDAPLVLHRRIERLAPLARRRQPRA